MIDIEKKIVYKVFGLHVVSEIPLPELLVIDEAEEPVEVVIEQADLTALWPDLAETNKHFVIKEDFVMFWIPDIAIFLIQDGNKITFSPVESTGEDQIRLYILGSCMGALLMQRKIFPLHGSAVAIDGKAYAIVGDSGAGKSTLASAFLSRGYQLLSDDVIPVSFSEQNIPIVTPAYPQQKLWLESLEQFGMESAHYRPIFDRETKFAVPVSAQFATEPLPLAGVFELVKTDHHEIVIQPIQKMERFHTLFKHTYRNFFITQSGLMEWHFNTSVKIVNKIDLYQLRRPISRFTAHHLTDLILTALEKGETIYD
ncbi:aldolase [Domibacillus mangrovi]|uniref:Aldolase n=1 Tax=Domibacillus mangrovi TaxID=1714354 RepID=A0A1Q5P325_9BACI|nr:aldolase [Domibacillus mangrovi]OKL36571.1 aldolase [Domibacillus mangrovi]